MPPSVEDDDALLPHPNAHPGDDRCQIDLMFDFLHYMMDVKKEAILHDKVNDLCQEINQATARSPYYGGGRTLLNWSSRDNIPEALSPNPADNRVFSLLSPPQDDGVRMADDQDILPPWYLHNQYIEELELPPSLVRVDNTSLNSGPDIPRQSYPAKWFHEQSIPPMVIQYNIDIPATRGPGLRFPWQLYDERRLIDAGQTRSGHGQSNPIDFQPNTGHRKALLIGITYWQEARSLKMPVKDVKLMKNLLMGNYSLTRRSTDHSINYGTEVYHYKPEDIVIMTDELDAPRHLQPERANIVRQIQIFLSVIDLTKPTTYILTVTGNKQISTESG
jgi:hypothetical protein